MSLAAVIVENRSSIDIVSICNNHLKFLPSSTNLYIFNKDPINSIPDYINLLLSESFWNRVKEENILIFQHDSALLRSGIEEFYKYDYIGARFGVKPYVGNGGLSFRHKSAMLKVIKDYKPRFKCNEDLFFSMGCKELGLNLATPEMADTFSIESHFKLGSLGYHAIDKYLSKEQVNIIRNQYLV